MPWATKLWHHIAWRPVLSGCRPNASRVQVERKGAELKRSEQLQLGRLSEAIARGEERALNASPFYALRRPPTRFEVPTLSQLGTQSIGKLPCDRLVPV